MDFTIISIFIISLSKYTDLVMVIIVLEMHARAQEPESMHENL